MPLEPQPASAAKKGTERTPADSQLVIAASRSSGFFMSRFQAIFTHRLRPSRRDMASICSPTQSLLRSGGKCP